MDIERLRIVCIDEDVAYRQLVHNALNKDYDVDFFECAEDFVDDYMHTSNYDLLLIDDDLPCMTGVEVCEYMKDDSLLQSVPVIVVSSVGGAEGRRRAEQAGCDDYIEKGGVSLEPAELLSMVECAVECTINLP